MKTTIIILSFTFLISCGNKISEESLFGKEEIHSEKVMGLDSKSSTLELFKRRKRNKHKIDTSQLRTVTTPDGKHHKVDSNGNRVFIPKLLPKEYAERDFLKITNKYDINDLTGGIVKLVDEGDDINMYKLASLNRYAKDTKLPENVLIDDGNLYKSVINQNVNFNASYLVANVSAEGERIIELSITDVSRTNLKLGEFDEQRLIEFYNQLRPEVQNQYFIIKSIVLTTISSRELTSFGFSTNVDAQFFTVGGNTYSSNESMSTTRTLSADLIQLSEVLPPTE